MRAVRKKRTRVLIDGPGWDSVRLPAAVAHRYCLDDAVERLTTPDKPQRFVPRTKYPKLREKPHGGV
jgi:hypothetical protein